MIELVKTCSSCGVEKPTDKFTRNKTKKHGLDSSCKLCKSRRDKEYRRKNKHKLREYFAEYHLLNKENRVRRACDWQKKNRGKANANSRKNEIKRRDRVPVWLSKEESKQIQDLYSQAEGLTKSTGTVYHVDHIIPLCGKYVSGLHVLSNLQIITAEENLSKSNKFMIWSSLSGDTKQA